MTISLEQLKSELRNYIAIEAKYGEEAWFDPDIAESLLSVLESRTKETISDSNIEHYQSIEEKF